MQREIIDYDTEPKTNFWSMIPLFKISKSGKTLFWQVGFDSKNIESTHGFVDGKIRTDLSEVITNMTGRNSNQQALIIARHSFLKKFRNEGYRAENEELKESDKEPMLCSKFVDVKNPVFPMFIQEKLDGIRLIASKDGLKTGRGNRENKYLDTVRLETQRLLKNLPEGSILDGEAYNKDWSFNLLTSVFKTEKTKHPLNDQVQYFIFDIILPDDPACYSVRHKLLKNAWLRDVYKSIQIIDYGVINSTAEVKKMHDQWVGEGKEGVILRIPKKPYQHGRSKFILKYKEFDDEECTVLDIIDSTGTEKGCGVFIVRDPRGNEFPVRPRGSFDFRKEALVNKKDYIGKLYTIRYFGLSEYGVPRQPVGIAFRDYE